MAQLEPDCWLRLGPRARLSPCGPKPKWALKRLQEPGVHEPSTWSGPQHQPVPKPTHISHVVGDSGRGLPGTRETSVGRSSLGGTVSTSSTGTRGTKVPFEDKRVS